MRVFNQGILCAITKCLHCEALAKQWAFVVLNSSVLFVRVIFMRTLKQSHLGTPVKTFFELTRRRQADNLLAPKD